MIKDKLNTFLDKVEKPARYVGGELNSTEKTDELAALHRYKAGYIAKYISLLIIAITICIIKNFEPIFTDYYDNITIGIVILLLGELITNITFIILEKFQLD